MEFKEMIIKELESYMAWETKYDFTGWENVGIYVADTLGEAFVAARPKDAAMVEDNPELNAFWEKMPYMWLGKKSEEEKGMVMISLANGKDPLALAGLLARLLRRCLDLESIIKENSPEEYKNNKPEYSRWMSDRASDVQKRFAEYRKSLEPKAE